MFLVAVNIYFTNFCKIIKHFILQFIFNDAVIQWFNDAVSVILRFKLHVVSKLIWPHKKHLHTSDMYYQYVFPGNWTHNLLPC